MTSTRYTIRATANCCGFTGTLAAIELHDCTIQESGGRCEDFPCCGHTDGDGCQTLPEHTSTYYLDNPQFLFEPGSPEWFDAIDEGFDDEGDDETMIIDLPGDDERDYAEEEHNRQLMHEV